MSLTTRSLAFAGSAAPSRTYLATAGPCWHQQLAAVSATRLSKVTFQHGKSDLRTQTPQSTTDPGNNSSCVYTPLPRHWRAAERCGTVVRPPILGGRRAAPACGRAGGERAASSHVEEMYAKLVLEGQIDDEPRQRELARRLGGLQESLRAKSREMEAKNTWWGSVAHKAAELSRTITPRPVVGGGGSGGVYIYGGVGVGKSLLMDLFFSSLPTSRKRRTHYHAFMNDVHRQAHLITQRAGYRGDVMKVYIVT